MTPRNWKDVRAESGLDKDRVRDAGYDALAAEMATTEGRRQQSAERAHRDRRAAAWADG